MNNPSRTFLMMLHHACRIAPGKFLPLTLCTVLFLSACLVPLVMAYRMALEPVKFQEKSVWIQVGNQIKEIDARMFEVIDGCGFTRIIFLNSAVDDRGYFPILRSCAAKCRTRGIKVSMGDLVFKEAYLKHYWERNPQLRKKLRDGTVPLHPYYRFEVCPNNPINQQYVADQLVEKAREAGVDEVHVDYECTACYCRYCIKDFLRESGKDARDLSPEDPDWRNWRSCKTAAFFETLARKISKGAPSLKISATAPIIGPRGGFTEYGIDLRYEDIAGFVDEFIPMIYISELLPPELAGRKHLAVKRRLRDSVVTPGLLLAEEKMGSTKNAERFRRELTSVYRAGARGIVIFEVRFINEEIVKILREC
ncbi:MAG: family 10 glycosylhydrolase [Candidatus Eremiobacteraeota bacterium]|nr:family 10 glycosylhydrolase [Candidatus Eremiobacteraeota bacterium]